MTRSIMKKKKANVFNIVFNTFTMFIATIEEWFCCSTICADTKESNWKIGLRIFVKISSTNYNELIRRIESFLSVYFHLSYTAQVVFYSSQNRIEVSNHHYKKKKPSLTVVNNCTAKIHVILLVSMYTFNQAEFR